MIIDTIERIISFIALCLLQVVVLNHIHLFSVATPLFYIIFILHFPSNYSRSGIMLWCFAMGIVIDCFGNTPGVASASMTLLGALQPYILRRFMSHEVEEMVPSLSVLGVQSFFSYLSCVTLLYCLLYFSLEMFSFAHLSYWIENVIGSTILTVLLIFVVEIVRKR